MAVGYSRTATVQVLLDFGADPETADKEGRNPVDLVEKLRGAMPLTAELLGRRTMLEDVAAVLTGKLTALWQMKNTFTQDCLRKKFVQDEEHGECSCSLRVAPAHAAVSYS